MVEETNSTKFYVSESDKINDNIKEINTLEELASSISASENPTFTVSSNPGKVVFQRVQLDKENVEYKDIDYIYKKHTHPYFEKRNIESLGDTKSPIDSLFEDKSKKILLFTPHQDDEVLGASAVISKCFQNDVDLKIIYMTSGKGGGNSDIRKQEAIEGVKVLGGKNVDENLIFMSFPFYNEKDRSVTDPDYELMHQLLEKMAPTDIFICSDVFDPNRSHRKCYDILMKTIYDYKPLQVNQIKLTFDVYFYYSTWYWPKENEFNYYLAYDRDHYVKKVKSMLEHKSQIFNGFMGEDKRPFYERVTNRDSQFGKINGVEFCEIYYKLS